MSAPFDDIDNDPPNETIENLLVTAGLQIVENAANGGPYVKKQYDVFELRDPNGRAVLNWVDQRTLDKRKMMRIFYQGYLDYIGAKTK